MGKRGPQPGFKAAAQAAALAPATLSTPAAPKPQVQTPRVLSAADRENPNKLDGEALRDLAHRRGLARSQMEGMSDDKVRRELAHIIARQYEPAEA